MIERSLQFYCLTHDEDTDGRVPGVIVCGKGGEILADSNFPRGVRYAYCCDCQRFWLPDFYGDRAKRAEKRCRSCGDEIKHWYLCDRCEFITVETDKPSSVRKLFTFGGKLVPQPSCPGCLAPPGGRPWEHLCTGLSVDGEAAGDAEGVIVHITMTLKYCPFCGEEGEAIADRVGERPAPRVQKDAGLMPPGGAAVKEELPPPAQPWWRELWLMLTSRWMAWATAVSFVIGVLSLGLGVFAYAFPTAPVQAYTWLKRAVTPNRRPAVKIDCPNEVLEGRELSLEARVDDDEDVRTLDYQWTCGDPKGRITWQGSRATFFAGEIKPLTVVVPVLVTVTVTDGAGQTASVTKTVYVTTPSLSNTRPSIEGITPIPSSAVQAGGSITLDANASDLDRDQLDFRWHTTDGQIVGEGRRVTLHTVGVEPQGSTPITATVTLNVEDGRGEPATKDIRINIYQRHADTAVVSAPPTPLPPPPTPSNAAPTISSLQADKTTVQVGEEVTVEAEVNDADNDKLFYEWHVPEIQVVSPNNSRRFTFRTSDIRPRPGGSSVTVYLYVSDEHKARDAAHVTIKVLPPPPTPTPMPTPSPPPSPHPTPTPTPERAPEGKTPPEKKPEAVREQARRGRRPRGALREGRAEGASGEPPAAGGSESR